MSARITLRRRQAHRIPGRHPRERGPRATTGRSRPSSVSAAGFATNSRNNPRPADLRMHRRSRSPHRTGGSRTSSSLRPRRLPRWRHVAPCCAGRPAARRDGPRLLQEKAFRCNDPPPLH